MNSFLTVESFKQVLDDALNQVTRGKGEERHGRGTALEDQPWVHISKAVGDGFLLGQALKKITELRSLDKNASLPAWEREALGAIVYLTFAIMWYRHEKQQKAEEESVLDLSIEIDPYKILSGMVPNDFMIPCGRVLEGPQGPIGAQGRVPPEYLPRNQGVQSLPSHLSFTRTIEEDGS